jgi:phosphoglycerate-specific signal transduction histidine kinase
MKLSFLLSIALAVIAVVAVFVLWSVLDAMGVFDSVGRSVESVTRSSANQGVDIYAYVGLGRVLSVTVLLAGVNVVLMTALCTLAAFMYNMAASLVGGLHVTFTEDV